jgi:hypothetical protein
MASAARQLIERIDSGSPPNHDEAVKIVASAFARQAAGGDKGGDGKEGDKEGAGA